jgi:SSS family solute:Na+ symporter
VGRLHPLDWAVVGLYGAAVIWIGFAVKKRQRATEDYLLAGRSLPWWLVGLSLISASFSSSALLGGTGQGFTKGLGWFQLQLGDLLAVALACALFLPFYAGLGLTTSYEYLERRFGVGARTLASAMFIGQTMLRTGILVLGPALALSALLGFDLTAAIVLSGSAALLYSSVGGLAAVIWTDLIQFPVVLFGLAYALVLVAGDVPGGLPRVWEEAAAAGRLDVIDASLSSRVWSHPAYTLVGALVAYGTLALSYTGTNQQAVQRYLACRDVAAARRAAFLGWGLGLLAMGTTLFLGVALSVWSESAPGGEALAGAGDRVLPLFIAHRTPVGVSGLLVAAIFAASMSSMDSAIHAMSTATLVDFVRRFRRRPLEPARELLVARILTAAYGVLGIGAALLAAARGAQLLETLVTWLAFVAGPLFGLFLLGIFVPRANQGGALAGAGVGILVVVLVLALGLPPGVHPLWLAPIAAAVTVAVGLAASLLGRPPPPERIEGLTWSRRRRA